MNTLPLDVRSPEADLELDIPLHAYTDSDIHVAQLVGILLDDIGGFDGEVSHADILQALGITTAVRAAMAEAAATQGADFAIESSRFADRLHSWGDDKCRPSPTSGFSTGTTENSGLSLVGAETDERAPTH